jgi:hypothetical protein
MLIIYLFSSALIFLYSLVLGLGLTKLIKKDFFYFPILFSILLGGLSFVLWITKLQIWYIYLIPFLILLYPFYQKIKEIKKGEKELLIIFGLQFLFYVILQLFIYLYPMGRNWTDYYNFSLDIAESGFNFKGERTPLFSLIEGAFLTIFGKSFYIAQITSALAGALTIFPFYLLSKKFIKPKFIYISLLFLIFNPFVIENSLYNWAKMQTTMFVLYFIVFILEKRYIDSYVSSLSGFLSHALSLFFVLPAYVWYGIKYRWRATKIVIIFLLSVLLIILIKTYTGYKDYFIFYPFAVNGYETVIGKGFGEVWAQFISKPIYYHFFVRIVNLLNTVLPVIPIVKLVNYFVNLPIIQLHKIINLTNLPLVYYYFHSIPGALTSGVYIFFVIWIIKNFKTEFSILFVIVPILLAASFFGWIKAGVTRDMLQPIIPIGIILGVSEMSKHPKKISYIVFSIMILELIIFFVLYNNYMNTTVEYLKSIGDNQTLSIETINKLVFNRG